MTLTYRSHVAVAMMLACAVAFRSYGAAESAASSGASATTDAANAYLAAVAPRSGLAYNAADAVASFTAPSGQIVQVIVKAPSGLIAGAACSPPKCFRMRAINPAELPDVYFPAALAAALAAHATRLVVPRATYNFKGPMVGRDSRNAGTCNEAHYWNCIPHWTIGTYPEGPMRAPAAVTDLDIDLSGSLLNFAAPTTGIWILNAARVRLENFSVDWPALHIASLGTIVPDPANPGHQALVLDAAYSATDPLTGGPVQVQAVDPWEDSTDPAVAPGRFGLSATNEHETYFIFGASQPTYLGKTSAGTQTFSCATCKFMNTPAEPGCSMFKGCANFDLFRNGARVIVRHYTYNGFALLVNWSNDIDLERIHILSGPGMGIAVQNAGGFRGFRLTDSSIVRRIGQLISTASDGINLSAFAGDIIVQNNEIAYQGDDGINLSPSTQAIAVSDAGRVGVTASCTPNPRDLVVANDVLAFLDAGGSFRGTARAASVAGSPCSSRSAVSVTLACTGSSNCTSLVNALVPGDSFFNLTQQPVARYVIDHNSFHENRGQGTQAGAPYGKITDNTYFRNSMGAINVDAGGMGASSVLVLGNKLN